MNIIFVFAHPDDESFSSGGTIARLAEKGAKVKLITATRGEAGELGDPLLCAKEELGTVREKELQKAAKILGISHVYFLDFIDGTLHTLSQGKTRKKILEILEQEKPDIVVTFNKEGGSKHPDHIQISKSTTVAFKKYSKRVKKHVKLYYTANPRFIIRKLEQIGAMQHPFGKVKGMPRTHISTFVDISSTMKKKIAALREHKTQHKDVERFLKRQHLKEFTMEFFRLEYENSIL